MKPYLIFKTAACCIGIFGAVAFLSSCKKEKADTNAGNLAAAKPDIQRIWECHNRNNQYPSQITARIEGTWVWQSRHCGSTASTTIANKHVVVTFNDGGLYKVFESSRLVSEGSWSLQQDGTTGSWIINTSSSTPYLHGYVLICDGEALFYSGYIDGGDDYFVKD